MNHSDFHPDQGQTPEVRLKTWLLALGNRERALNVSQLVLTGFMVWLSTVLGALILDRWLGYTVSLWFLVDALLITGLIALGVVAMVVLIRLRPRLKTAAQLASERGVSGRVPVAAEYLAQQQQQVTQTMQSPSLEGGARGGCWGTRFSMLLAKPDAKHPHPTSPSRERGLQRTNQARTENPTAHGSAALWTEAVRRAAQSVQDVSAKTLLPATEVKRSLLFLLGVLVFAGALIALPTGLMASVKRMLVPGADLAPYTPLDFDLRQSPDPVTLGESASIAVTITWPQRHEPVTAATLETQDRDGAVRRLAMTAQYASSLNNPNGLPTDGVQTSAQFIAHVNRLQPDDRYRVRTPYGRTNWQAWGIDPTPRIQRFAATWQPPAYTQLANGQTSLLPGGRLRVAEGSQIELVADLNRAIDRGSLSTPEVTDVSGITSAQTLTVSETAGDTGDWTVTAYADGLNSSAAVRIRVIPDEAPQVIAGFDPQANEPTLTSAARDDYRLTERLWDFVRLEDNEPVRVAGLPPESINKPQATRKEPLGDLMRQAGLAPGDIVWVEVEAADNKAPAVQRTRVRTQPMMVTPGNGPQDGDGEQGEGQSQSGGLGLIPLSEALGQCLGQCTGNGAPGNTPSYGQGAGSGFGTGTGSGSGYLSRSTPGTPGTEQGAGNPNASETNDATANGDDPSGGGVSGDSEGSGDSGGPEERMAELLEQAAAAGLIDPQQAQAQAEAWRQMAGQSSAASEAQRQELAEQTQGLLDQLPESSKPEAPPNDTTAQAGEAETEADTLPDGTVITRQRGVLRVGAWDPEALQEAMQNVQGATQAVPPAYREQVQAYFRALAEQSSAQTQAPIADD